MRGARTWLSVLAMAAAVPPVYDAGRTLTRGALAGRPDPELLLRLEPLRAHLAGVPVLCYLPRDYVVALTDPGANPVAATRANQELYLAQRVFAPTLVRLVDVDPTVAWTLGNFAGPAAVPADWRERGLEIVADDGRGLVLFKPKGR